MVKFEGSFDVSSTPAILAKGDVVTIPDAHFLFTADFSREGHDLLMIGEDGKSLLVVDYFGSAGSPDLAAPNGAILTSSVVESLAGPLAPGQYAQVGDQQPAAAIGKVVLLDGTATAQRTDGTVVELHVGDSLAIGDVLQTGLNSAMGVTFEDGSVFNLSASSRMVLDNLVYQPGGTSNALNFNFVQGTFSFVAGQIAPTGEMRMDTPVATMGIRGTSGIATVYAVDGVVIYRVIQDPGSDHTGAYVLLSKSDPGTVLATVNASDLQWVLNSPTGIPTTEPADASGRDIINELIKSYNAATGKDVPLIKAENEGGETPNVHVITGGSGIDPGPDGSLLGGLETQLVGFFAALAEDAPAEYLPTEYQTSNETETYTDTSNPIIVNQPATFGGAETGNAVEDVGTSTGGTLVVNDPNQGQSGVQPLNGVAGTFGTFSINAAGQWTYVLNNDSTAVQALGEGVTATDSFQVTSADGSATITIVITITGTNDGATIEGEQTTGTAAEDGTATASGSLSVSDPDSGESVFQVQSGTASAYGTFSINAAGQWTYVLNNNGAAVQALGAGVTVTDSFQVVSADGTATQTVVITVTGSNDGATIGGSDITGAVAEDGTATATGSLSVSDPDAGESSFQVQSGQAGTYGTFSMDAAGHWTYVLNNDNPAVQALTAGQTVTDSFQVVSADGTATQTVVITVTGGNDGATIEGTDTGAVTEDVTTTTTGSLTVSDPDAGQSSFQAQSGIAGVYGTFSIDASGQWSYTLNNASPAVQALAAGVTVTETFTVTSADGSATSNVVITVHGTNDGAVISDGPAPGDGFAGAVAEDGVGTASGSLSVADPDTGEAAFQVQAAHAGNYGSFSIDASGQWTYVLNNASPAVQSLAGGQVVTDSFEVVSADGTATQTVVITVTGSNDGATVINGPGEGDVTEDTATTTTGSLSVSDPDAGQSSFQVQTGTGSDYGTFSINAAGVWTYQLNNASSAVQSLGAGETATDTFTVTSADGSSTSSVVITIHGTNDGAVIDGDTAGNVYEDNVASGSTFGNVTSSDIDGVDNSFQAVGEPIQTASGYGSYTIDAAGHWSYTVNNGSEAVNALNNNETLTDTFTIYAADGTPQEIQVTIHGHNDAPLGVSDTFTTTEDHPIAIDPAALLGNDNDVDNAQSDLSIYSVTEGTGGSVNVSEGGVITFTPDEDFSGQATFYYQVQDGSGGVSGPIAVTVDVTAVADQPYLTASTVTGGFETGDFTGWQTMGDTYVASQFQVGDISAYPQEGDHMAVLGTNGATQAEIETFLGLPAGTLDNQGNGDATVGSTMTFELQVNAGDQVSFNWNFITNDYMPYNDYAVVTVNGAFTELADVQSLGNTIGNESSTGWQTYTYTATETGTLTIGVAVVDVGDAIVDSSLLIDNVQVNSGTSIPLAIDADLADTDGSETLSVAITGLPEGATLSAGTQNQDGSWTLTQPQLVGLAIIPPTDYSGTISLIVTATATENSNGSTAQTTTTIEVNVGGADNDQPVAQDDSVSLYIDLTVSPHGDTTTIDHSQLLENDSDPNNDSLSIISVPQTSDQGATLAVNGNGDVEYTPPPSFNALHGQGQNPIVDQFTYTISDGHGGTSTATVQVEVYGDQQQISFAAFSAIEDTSTAGSDLVPGEPGAKFSKQIGDEKSAGGQAAAIASLAAALTSLGAQGLHAAQYGSSEEPRFDLLHSISNSNSGHPSPFAAVGKFDHGAELPQIPGKPDVGSFVSPQDAHHLSPASLSDILSQHFASLSGDDPAASELHSDAGKPAAFASAPDNAARGHERGADAEPRSHAEKVEALHDAPPKPHAGPTEFHHDAPGKADGVGAIVDFSSLPLPVHASPDVGAKTALTGHFKFGDLNGMLDFSRDLMPNATSQAPALDRGGGAQPGPAHHQAPPEAHHVAVNDVIQTMASDAESAHHHAH